MPKKRITSSASLKKRKSTPSKKVDSISVGTELNDKQKFAVWLYVYDKDCFGIPTKAYQKAYNVKYDVAKSAGPRLFANVHIVEYKNKLLEAAFNDTEVDRQLTYVMLQNKDLRSKVGAIQEINKLKRRITEKVDITSKGHAIVGINYVKPNGNNTDSDD